MEKIQKYDGNFKNMDYTFYKMSRKLEKKKIKSRKSKNGKRRYQK
jgi:hypothetical protein